MMHILKKNNDIVAFCIIHSMIFTALITGVKYFPLDLPTVMYINKSYGLWGIFTTSPGNRYWPLSQFVSSAVTQIFGNEILFQWIIQYLLFIVLTLLVWKMSYLLCKSRKIAFCAVIFLICATPMSENVFTLGKPEIVLCIMLLVCALLIYKIVFQYQRVLLFVSFFIFSYLAFISKETSVIILPMMALICAFVLFVGHRKSMKKAAGLLMLECLVAYILFFIVKKFLTRNIPSSYTDYNMSISMVFTNLLYYAKYCWDVILIGILSNILCIQRIYNIKKFTSKDSLRASISNNDEVNSIAFSVIMNIVGWGYLLGISLWRFCLVYYAFPCAVFFTGSFCMSLRIQKNKGKKYLYLLVPVIFALIYGSWNGYLIAASTRDVSSMFSESIDFMLYNKQINGEIYAENFMFYEESPYQMNRLFNFYDKNLTVIGIRDHLDSLNPSDEMLSAYGYTRDEYIEKSHLNGFEVGDYILLYENKRNNWVPSRYTNPSYDGTEKLEQYGWQLEKIAGNRIIKNRLTYSIRGGIYKAEEVCGWSIYQVIGRKDELNMNE